jgi:glycosyltransferase involved in cell wall biosynthesis
MVFPRWLLWPHTVRAWWHALDRELAPADLYHACGSLAIAPALAARERDRKAGRRSIVLYDAIDNVVEGNNMLAMPSVVRRLNLRREAGWARAADGLLTVNEGLAERLGARWHPGEPVLVVPNWPETGTVADARADVSAGSEARADLIRRATGLPASSRVVLFQGRLGPNLGLEPAAEAVLRVPNAALVLIGFGRSLDECRARDRDPRHAGRHFTLPAVHPDELLAWTASADVSVVPLPPVSVNQRQSTPNKFWESLAAGTPVVIGPGLELMERLVREHDLGAVAASLSPDDLAVALRDVLDVTPEAAGARRGRIAALAAERFSWGTAAAAYLALVARLAGAGAGTKAGAEAGTNAGTRP